MGYFGNKLKRIMEQTGMTFQRIADRSGLSRSAINHIALGKIESPDRENVERIISVFSSKEHIHDLALAHLEDEMPVQARELLEIKSRVGSHLKESSAPDYANKLDSAFEDAVDRIRRSVPENESLRKTVIMLADACCE